MLKEILVIDDNPDIRFLVSNILEEQNYKIRTAANYDQAVLEINKRLPDLAILDIKLDKPDKDGIDLLKLIIKKNKNIPVIMISGHATVKVAVEAIRLGAYEFIEKPFSKEKILNYVNRGLESSLLKKEKDIIENKLFHSFDLIGDSPDMVKVRKTIEKLSSAAAPGAPMDRSLVSAHIRLEEKRILYLHILWAKAAWEKFLLIEKNELDGFYEYRS